MKKYLKGVFALGLATSMVASCTVYAASDNATVLQRHASSKMKGVKQDVTQSQMEDKHASVVTDMTSKLDEMLSSNEITQDEYDEAVKELSEKTIPTVLKDYLQSKKSIGNLTLNEEMIAKITSKLDEMLSSNEVTQDEYDEAIAEINEGKMPSALKKSFQNFSKENKIGNNGQRGNAFGHKRNGNSQKNNLNKNDALDKRFGKMGGYLKSRKDTDVASTDASAEDNAQETTDEETTDTQVQSDDEMQDTQLDIAVDAEVE